MICIGDGREGSGCGEQSGDVCPYCGGMLLSDAALAEAEKLADKFMYEREKKIMECKWGFKPDELKNSTAWICTYPIPLSLVAGVNYSKMQINECNCTPEKCRCFTPKNY